MIFHVAFAAKTLDASTFKMGYLFQWPARFRWTIVEHGWTMEWHCVMIIVSNMNISDLDYETSSDSAWLPLIAVDTETDNPQPSASCVCCVCLMELPTLALIQKDSRCNFQPSSIAVICQKNRCQKDVKNWCQKRQKRGDWPKCRSHLGILSHRDEHFAR